MEKRLLLAVVLMTAAILITNILFPPPEAPTPAVGPDTMAVSVPIPPRAPILAAPIPGSAGERADSVIVTSELYRLTISTSGLGVQSARLLRFPSYVHPGETVQLVPQGETGFLAHRLVIGADTLDLRGLVFRASARTVDLRSGNQQESVTFTYADATGFAAELTYTFRGDSYLIGISGRLQGLGGEPVQLLTNVGPGLDPHEAADHHNERELAIVTHTGDRVARLRLDKVQGRQPLDARLTWAGIKDKYFLVALIGGTESPFSGAVLEERPSATLTPAPGEGSVPLPRALLTTALPVGADGSFSFDAYLGPQDYSRLAAIGEGLEDVTPYGYRWLQPVIRPLAAAILWVLSALHNTFGFAYGWVLVIFGVLMRVVLWPLNAKAMRAQMKNMAVQPLFQEIREKYKDDPQQQQQEMIKLYKEHGFNPLAGCLPLLIPMPVLITLFFVFQNTIGFRGAEFLWLPDLSLRDPFYILPVFLVVSTFALQWVSTQMSGIEPNAQMKMMMYFMPVMMGVIFFALPAGLNLYYATTQIASIPQQMLISRERRRAQEALKLQQPPKLSASPAPPPRKRRQTKKKG